MAVASLPSISNKEIQTLVLEFGKSHIKTEKFDVFLESVSKNGENYTGEVHRLTFKSQDENQNKDHADFNAILKQAPSNPQRRETFICRKIYLREIQAYTEVFPTMDKFQRSSSLHSEQYFFKEYVKCYGTNSTDMNECLLLEDVTASGFSMLDRHKEIATFHHVELVMGVLGKFHAISLALRDQQPEKFKEIITNNMKENMFDKSNQGYIQYFELIQSMGMKMLSDEQNAQLSKNIGKYFEAPIYNIAVDSVNGEAAEPYAVLCHGDCWGNNMMFKYNENGKPIDMRLIDWQAMRYASPVTDIIFAMVAFATKVLRELHFNNFITIYYNSLSSTLKTFGSDPEKLFPFDALIDQFQKFGKFGIPIGTTMANALTMECADVPDFEAEELNEKHFQNNAPAFDEFLKDVLIFLTRFDLV